MTITIRRAVSSDAASYARIMGDPLFCPALLQMPHPGEEGWRTRLAELGGPAIRLYRKFSFRIEGRHRGYALRDGRYVAAVSMARLRPQPPSVEPGPVDDAT